MGTLQSGTPSTLCLWRARNSRQRIRVNTTTTRTNSGVVGDRLGALCRAASGKTSTVTMPLPVVSTTQQSQLEARQQQLLRELRHAATFAVGDASAVCRNVSAARGNKNNNNDSGDGEEWRKGDRTPVTVTDYAVQAIVSLRLQWDFPSIPFLAEEDAVGAQ